MIRTAWQGDKGETGTRPLPDPSSFPQREPRPLSGDDSDANLLARCQSGDDAAWEQLVAKYERLVYSTALQTGLDRQDAADVFQQVWFEVYRSLMRIRDMKSLTRWLITTTGRLAYRHALVSRLWVREVLEDLVDPSPDAQANLDRLETLQRLESGLSRLGGRCEQLLRILFFSRPEPAYRDISRRMGLDENSVGPTRTRCLRRLRKLMEETS